MKKLLLLLLIGVFMISTVSATTYWTGIEPTAYYKFENNLDDTSANLNTLTDQNLTFNADSKLGTYAGNFSTTTSPYNFNSSFTFGTNAFTVAFWVKISRLDAGYGLIGTDNDNDGNTQWVIRESSGNLKLRTGDTQISNVGSVAGMVNDEWQRVVLVREGTGADEMKVYINGSNTANGTFSFDLTDSYFRLGYYANSYPASFDGLMDEVIVYNGNAWTPADVVYDYNSGAGRSLNIIPAVDKKSCDNLQLIWRDDFTSLNTSRWDASNTNCTVGGGVMSCGAGQMALSIDSYNSTLCNRLVINRTVSITDEVSGSQGFELAHMMTYQAGYNRMYTVFDGVVNDWIASPFAMSSGYHSYNITMNATRATVVGDNRADATVSVTGTYKGNNEKIKFRVIDANGASDIESIEYWAVPTIFPTVTIVSPLNATYAYTENTILVNITSDGNSIWYNWEGINVSYTTPINVLFNYGSNTLTVFANNSDGETSSSVTFFVESPPIPNIQIVSPLNDTYNYTENTILVNITSDGDSVWYNWNGGNISYTSPVNILFDYGSNTLTVFANNTLGYENSSTVTFFIISPPIPPATYYIVSDYEYLVISDAGLVAQDTTTSLASTVNWFGIIIVIVVMVALILLTVLIINVIRGNTGFESAGGTA